MDIIPLDRFQEKLTEDLLDIKRVTKKPSWSDLLAHWVAKHFLRLENSQPIRACGMQGSGEEGTFAKFSFLQPLLKKLQPMVLCDL